MKIKKLTYKKHIKNEEVNIFWLIFDLPTISSNLYPAAPYERIHRKTMEHKLRIFHPRPTANFNSQIKKNLRGKTKQHFNQRKSHPHAWALSWKTSSRKFELSSYLNHRLLDICFRTRIFLQKNRRRIQT